MKFWDAKEKGFPSLSLSISLQVSNLVYIKTKLYVSDSVKLLIQYKFCMINIVRQLVWNVLCSKTLIRRWKGKSERSKEEEVGGIRGRRLKPSDFRLNSDCESILLKRNAVFITWGILHPFWLFGFSFIHRKDSCLFTSIHVREVLSFSE